MTSEGGGGAEGAGGSTPEASESGTPSTDVRATSDSPPGDGVPGTVASASDASMGAIANGEVANPTETRNLNGETTLPGGGDLAEATTTGTEGETQDTTKTKGDMTKIAAGLAAFITVASPTGAAAESGFSDARARSDRRRVGEGSGPGHRRDNERDAGFTDSGQQADRRDGS